MKYDHVLFDLDGTLTDSKEGITRCVQYALRRFGIERDCDSLTDFIGPPLREMFESSFAIDGKRAVEIYRERFSTVGLFENRVYGGIPELLGKLKSAGIKTAVATSKPTVFTERILDKFELSGYFDCVVGSELDGRRTNKAEVIEEVLRRLNADRSRSIMVGDRRFDIEGAAKCGIGCIAVTYGFAADGEFDLCSPSAIADTVPQLADLLILP